MIGLLNSFMDTASGQVLKNIKKIDSIDYFQKFIKDVYDMKIQNEQLLRSTKQLSFDFGYGTLYSIIRQKLQVACRVHKSLICSSLSAYSIVPKNLYRVNVPASLQLQQQNLKLHEVMTSVLYYHFSNISSSNKQVCTVWQSIKDKIQYKNHINDINISIKTPQLRLSTLNLLALKELIPQNQYIGFNDYKYVLERLNKAKFVTKKEHIQELLGVYVENQVLKEIKEEKKDGMETVSIPQIKTSIQLDGTNIEATINTSTSSIKNTSVSITTTQITISSSDLNKILSKDDQSSRSKPLKKRKFPADSQLQKAIDRINSGSFASVSVFQQSASQDSNNQDEQWLQKAKQNKIARQLLDRLKLGGKFCKDERKKAVNNKVAEEVIRQMMTQNKIGFQLDHLKVVRTSEIMKAFQDKLKKAEQQQQMKQKNSKLQQSQATQRKKKRKNKKKKAKASIQSEQQEINSPSILKNKTIQNQKPAQKILQKQTQSNTNKNKQIKLSSSVNLNEVKNKQILNGAAVKYEKYAMEIKQKARQKQMEITFKQTNDTIKMLKQMKIDDTRRLSCHFEVKKLQNWRSMVASTQN